MANYFWRNVAMYAPRYKALVRVESLDFDPTVNRYFESQYIENGNTMNVNTNESHVHEVGSNTPTGSYVDTKTEEFEKDQMTVDTYTPGITQTDTYGQKKNTVDNQNIKDITKYQGKESEHKHGTDSVDGHSESHADNNATNVSESHSSVKAASKSAPMSATGLTNTGSVLPDGAGNTARITGKLGGLDFKYASSYTQTDSDAVTSGKTSEGHTNMNDSSHNATTYGNYVDREFNGRQDESTRTGKLVTTDDKYTNTSTKNGKDETRHQTYDLPGSKVTTTDQRDYLGFTETNESQHDVKGGAVDKSTRSNKSTNRYTGREGLTPQEAMMSASDYLMNYSVAFKWFIRKLDSCFNFNYDI